MIDISYFKATKKHPLLKKGILIDLMPCVYVYCIEDGKNTFVIKQSTIDYWLKKGYIKYCKS